MYMPVSGGKEVNEMSVWNKLLSMAGLANILVYGAIIVVFFLGVIKCVIPVWNTRRLLWKAIRNIKAGSNAKQSW